MIHLSGFLLAFAGFSLICLSMQKHQQEVLSRKLPPTVVLRLRVSGSLLIALGFCAAVTAAGIKRGSVEWVGQISLAALVVTLMLPYRPRAVPIAAMVSTAVGAGLWALAPG